MTSLASSKPLPASWVLDALCSQTDPELFFPDMGGTAQPAKRVCAACPVRAECRDYALGRPDLLGVWGGTTERERQAIRSSRRTTTEQGTGRADGRECAA